MGESPYAVQENRSDIVMYTSKQIQEILIDHLGFGNSPLIHNLYEEGILDRFKVTLSDDTIFYRGIISSKLDTALNYNYGVASRKIHVAEPFARELLGEDGVVNVLLKIPIANCSAVIDLVACYNYYNVEEDFAQGLIITEDEHFIIYSNPGYEIITEDK